MRQGRRRRGSGCDRAFGEFRRVISPSPAARPQTQIQVYRVHKLDHISQYNSNLRRSLESSGAVDGRASERPSALQLLDEGADARQQRAGRSAPCAAFNRASARRMLRGHWEQPIARDFAGWRSLGAGTQRRRTCERITIEGARGKSGPCPACQDAWTKYTPSPKKFRSGKPLECEYSYGLLICWRRSQKPRPGPQAHHLVVSEAPRRRLTSLLTLETALSRSPKGHA